MSKKTISTLCKKNFQQAFTLVELIVVVGIFAVIMSVALANQKGLTNNLLITNLAYEIGLSVRETQSYGIGVRAKAGADSTQDFQGGFGLYADISSPEQITIFKDLNEDKQYSGTNEVFALYQFQNQRGNKITAICIDHSNLSGPCTRNTGVDSVSIVFKRPNPEASFKSEGVARTGPAYIVLDIPSGKNCRVVVIEATGQVHIESGAGANPYCSNL